MPFVAPIRTYSLEDGYTDGLIVLEDRELCVWDEETQTAVPIGRGGESGQPKEDAP